MLNDLPADLGVVRGGACKRSVTGEDRQERKNRIRLTHEIVSHEVALSVRDLYK
jgi:hypothetical protein